MWKHSFMHAWACTRSSFDCVQVHKYNITQIQNPYLIHRQRAFLFLFHSPTRCQDCKALGPLLQSTRRPKLGQRSKAEEALQHRTVCFQQCLKESLSPTVHLHTQESLWPVGLVACWWGCSLGLRIWWTMSGRKMRKGRWWEGSRILMPKWTLHDPHIRRRLGASW